MCNCDPILAHTSRKTTPHAGLPAPLQSGQMGPHRNRGSGGGSAVWGDLKHALQ